MEPTENTPKIRWPRSQRFLLSGAGQEAHEAYREVIAGARAAPGRQSLDAARAAWATKLTLDLNDGLYLSELHEGPRTLEELAVALDGCGPSRQDVKAAIERLVRLRMLDLVVPPPPPAPPAPPPYRW